jgi:hypothetical protein
METLLQVAVVLITVGVIAQAAVLIAMYVMSKRITGKAEALMNDSRRLMAPLESATSNLKTVSDDLTQTGRIVREQAQHVQEMVSETQASIRQDMTDVRERILSTVDEARGAVMRPVRQCSAIAMGIAEGIRTFLFGSRTTVEKDRPAA